jgi:hypothetical protein
MPRVLTLAALGLGLWVSTARADGYRLHCTIPKLAPAYDYTTGGEFMAPPVPYGHYAKDYIYGAHSLMGCVSCRLHGLLGCCGGGLCGLGAGCGACGGKGCGHCSGGGLFGHHGGGSACLVPGCAGGPGCGHHHASRFAPVGPDCGVGTAIVATAQAQPLGVPFAQPSAQAACGQLGCGIPGLHSHKGHGRCGLCGGRGCGGCGGSGLGACGDPGCGLGHGHGNGCGFCGGKGCSHCLSVLSSLHGKLAGLLYHQKVDYFLGAGGPVPLTPGYVPYIVTTRSPRDFFAFPPMNPLDP